MTRQRDSHWQQPGVGQILAVGSLKEKEQLIEETKESPVRAISSSEQVEHVWISKTNNVYLGLQKAQPKHPNFLLYPKYTALLLFAPNIWKSSIWADSQTGIPSCTKLVFNHMWSMHLGYRNKQHVQPLSQKALTISFLKIGQVNLWPMSLISIVFLLNLLYTGHEGSVRRCFRFGVRVYVCV